MSKIDDLLKPSGLKYEELKPEEKETLHSWLEVLKTSKLTVNGIRDYIKSMRDSVEEKLTVATLYTRNDLFLKARLRNYMLLEAFLSTPEKAQKAIDAQIKGFAKKQ